MSNIIKSLEQLKKDYDTKLASLKDGLRKEVEASLTSARQVLDAAPKSLRAEVLSHPQIRGLIREMGGRMRNGTGATGATGKRGKLPTDALLEFCKGTPKSNSEINKHFGVKNCSNKVNTLKDEKKLEKMEDGKWLTM